MALAADDLIKLKELFDLGIITQEEFDAKKADLLGIPPAGELRKQESHSPLEERQGGTYLDLRQIGEVAPVECAPRTTMGTDGVSAVSEMITTASETGGDCGIDATGAQDEAPTASRKHSGLPKAALVGIATGIVVVIIAIVIAMASSSSGKTTNGVSSSSGVSSTSNATSSSNAAAKYDATAAKYKDYDSSVASFSNMISPTSKMLYVQASSNSMLQGASILFVFYDVYGDPLGTYDVELSATTFNICEHSINGLEKTSDAAAYVYAYILSDGTKWGNHNASQEEILSFGHRVKVGINAFEKGDFGQSSNTNSSKTTSSPASGSKTQSSTSSTKGDYKLPDSDTKQYGNAELERLSTYELFLARNEIYARHGRIFQNQELKDYFGSKSWYRGTIQPDDFSDSMLNDVERANASAMLEIEKSRNSPYLT